MAHFEQSAVNLLNSDVIDGLRSIDDNSIDLVLTSPPYNINKPYERADRRTLDEYADWCREIIELIDDKLDEHGAVCWQVGNFVKDSSVLPLDYIVHPIFSDLGYRLRNRIVWQFNFGLHSQKRLSGRYETLLWFTKSDSYTFNLDDIRVEQLYPGKKHSEKKGNGRAGKPSGNPKGKNPSDHWIFSGRRFFEEDLVWQLPNVKANHPELTEHPCQFPVELAERCVLAFTNPGDTILDPFIGSGTTAIAGLPRRRKVIGIDRDESYIELANERITALREGKLRVRPSGKSVRRPSLGEAVARVPMEWRAEGGSKKEAEKNSC